MRLLIIVLLCCLSLAGCSNDAPSIPWTPSARLHDALARLAAANSEVTRFYALREAAKQSFVLGNVDDARKYATELLTLAPHHRRDWNYGNAIHDGNLVLGRIAVREGRLADAKQFLEEAGKSPGSPQLDTFGPDMSLAKDLLEAGEKEVVLNYFAACKVFWEMHKDRLDHWAAEVNAGRIPDFGTNLR